MTGHEENNKQTLGYVGKWTCKYGKFKGKTFGEIAVEDPSYATWMAGIDKSEKVRAYLKSALGNRAQL